MAEDNLNRTLINTTIASTTSHPRLQAYTSGTLLAYNIYLSTIITLGVPGNLLALIIFMKIKLYSSTDWFIIFITFFDFMALVVNVPIYLSFTTGTWRLFGSDGLCKFHMYLSQIVVLSSASLIGGLALDRHVIICKNSSGMTSSQARKVCFLICFLAALFSILTLFFHEDKNGICTSKTLTTVPFLYFLFVFLIFIAVFVIVIVCYSKISLAIMRSTKALKEHRQVVSSIVPTRRKHFRFKSNKVRPDMDKANGDSGENSIKNTDEEYLPKDQSHKPSEKKARFEPLPTVSQGIQNTGDKNVKPYIGERNVRFCSNGRVAIETNDRQPSQYRRTLRTTKISFLVCSIFIVSWILPLSSFIMIGAVENKTRLFFRFVLFARMAYLINTITNPFLYAWLNNKFRKTLKTLLHCCRLK